VQMNASIFLLRKLARDGAHIEADAGPNQFD
jgi:hypothetical protein